MGDIFVEGIFCGYFRLDFRKASGGKSSNVIRTTIYLTDLNDFSKVNAIYAETFKGSVCPARACVEVSNLPKGGKIEIDCVAWLG